MFKQSLLIFSTIVLLAPSSYAGIYDDVESEREAIRQQELFNDVQNRGTFNNADQSKSDSSSTNIAGMIMGAMLMTQCGPTNPTACILAAMAFADAAMSAGNGSNSGITGAAVGVQETPGDGAVPGDTTEVDFQVQLEKAQQNLDKLAAMGYKVDAGEGSITVPSGSTLSGDDFSSVEKLEAAGLSTAQANDLVEKLGKKVKTRNLAKGGSGEGTSGARASTASVDDDANGNKSPVTSTSNKRRDLSSLARRLGSDLVGVASANIFDLVERKYRNERKLNNFK